MTATAPARQAKHPNLYAGPATPGQTRGLRRGNDLGHGAYNAARRQPLEDQHRDRLRRLYPDAPDDLINTQAKRLAVIDLFSATVADVGVLYHSKGRQDVTPAARELRLSLEAADRATSVLQGFAATSGRSAAERMLLIARGELEPGDSEPVDGELVDGVDDD